MKINLRQSLLASAAMGAMVLAGTGAPRPALADCTPSPNWVCSGNDANGVTASIATDGSITMNAGSSSSDTLRITLTGAAPNNDFTFTAGNTDNIVTGIPGFLSPGHGLDITTQNAGGTQTYGTALAPIQAQVNGVDGNGYNILLNNGGTVNMVLGASSLVTGTGTFDLAGVPVTGGGVVVGTLSGTANVNITNHGTFRTSNDGIFVGQLSGGGTNLVTNDGFLGTSVTRLGGAGAVIVGAPLLTSATGTINNNNGTIWATGNGGTTGDFGGAAVVVGGNAQVTNLSGNINTINDAGIQAVSFGTGTAVVDSRATATPDALLGTVTSTNGPGIVAISLSSTATIDAGEVTSGSGTVSLFGFSPPAVPGLPSLSGGVLALSSGAAVANAHGNITTTGNFGVLALSLNGAATATSDAGILIDPPIGMSAITFGANPATVTNNATLNTTQVGLLGVNLGNGTVEISNSTTGDVQASTGAGVLVVKTGPGAATPLTGGYSVAVRNDNTGGVGGGIINAQAGVGVGIIALDPLLGPVVNNVLVTNTNNASITGAGGLLTAAVDVGADGGVDIINDDNSTMTNVVGDAGFAQVVLAGGPISSRNTNNSDITGTLDLVSLGGGVVFTNDGQSEWTSSGINAFVAGSGNALINNTNDSDINMLAIGSVSANLMFASNDVIINNRNDSDFNMIGILGANFNVMGAGRDVIINNESGADFNMIDIAGANFNVMFADRNVTINNNTGASFNMVSVLGVAANVMVADEDATINNDTGASFTMAGIIGANGNFMLGGDNATINNTNGATFNLLGLNGNFMAAVNDVDINNETGARINLVGLNTLGFASLNGSTAVNNTSTVYVEGIATFNGLDDYNNTDGLTTMVNDDADNGPPNAPSPYGNRIGDIMSTDGNFNGGGTSTLAIDAFLRGPGADSASDLLLVGEFDFGNVTGATALLVNDLNAGAGAYNPDGILFAHVEGDAPEGSFFLPGGPIDKGFFSYDILRVETASSDWLLVSAPNDRADELAAIITGTQTLWYESSGVWLDRTADLRRQIGTCSPADEAAMSANVGGTQVTATADVAPECFYKRYGLWFRGFGGQYDRNEGTEYDQDIWGAEGGFDVVVDDDPSDGAVILGILGGYLGSKMNFDSTDDEAKFEGGSVGAYATYIYGGWFADLLFKANILDIDYDTNFDDPENDANTDALSLGVRLDTGYRFDTDGGFFIEPQGTIAYVHTEIDDYELLNTDVDPQDGESVRGRLGVRLGGSWDSGNMIFEPFLVGSVWHEFEGDNEVDLTSGASVTVSDELNSTWGEVGGGLNVFNADQSMSFFAKVDAQVGGDIESWSGKVGGRIAW